MREPQPPIVPQFPTARIDCEAHNLTPAECFKRGFYGAFGALFALVLANILAIVTVLYFVSSVADK